MEAGMLSTIDEETFDSSTKNTWIGNSGVSCYITYSDTGLYDVTKINELLQGSMGNMSTNNKGKLCRKSGKLMEVNCTKAGANLCSIICEVLQEKKIKSNHKNKIMAQSSKGNIILHCWIKTHDG